jgi:hypothetical protein
MPGMGKDAVRRLGAYLLNLVKPDSGATSAGCLRIILFGVLVIAALVVGVLVLGTLGGLATGG